MRYGRTTMIAVLTVSGVAMPRATQDRPVPSKVVHIVAERFSFTPAEITVEQGTTIEFRLTSDDTSHGFRLVGPSGDVGDVEIPKRNRGDVRVTFEAKESGRYTFECSRICGAGHGFMRGTVRVQPRSAASARVSKGGLR